MIEEFRSKLQAIINQVESSLRHGVQDDVESILQTGVDSYEGLLGILENREGGARTCAIVCWILARFEDERALPALIGALHDKNISLRREAVQALGMLGGDLAVDQLIATAHYDGEVEVRTAAVASLGLLRAQRASELLLDILTNRGEDPQVRGAAAEALGRLVPSQVTTPLIQALADPCVEVRFWAAFALGELGDPRALPELERLAERDDSELVGWWSVRKEATDAITKIKLQKINGVRFD